MTSRTMPRLASHPDTEAMKLPAATHPPNDTPVRSDRRADCLLCLRR